MAYGRYLSTLGSADAVPVVLVHSLWFLFSVIVYRAENRVIFDVVTICSSLHSECLYFWDLPKATHFYDFFRYFLPFSVIRHGYFMAVVLYGEPIRQLKFLLLKNPSGCLYDKSFKFCPFSLTAHQ